MEKETQIYVWYINAAVWAVVLLQQWWRGQQTGQTIPYSEFRKLLREDKIAEIVIAEKNIRGTLRAPLTSGQTRIYTLRVEPDLAKDFDKYGLKYTGVVESKFIANLLSWLVPIIVFFVIWMFIIYRFANQSGMGGFMSVGKRKAKIYMEKGTKVTFDDVAGVDEEKEELNEVVQFLEDAGTYGRLGARIPKGVLLVGPPGVGITLLARAAAGEAGVPFFPIYGPEFVEMFVSVGTAHVRDLFEQARKTAQAIDHAVRALIEAAFVRARGVLEKHRDVLNKTAAKLLECETLAVEELPDIALLLDQSGIRNQGNANA